MNVYEIFAIAHPSLSQEEFLTLVADLEKRLEQAQGRIVSRKIEADQSLAYPLEGEFKGHIVHVEVELPEGTELSREVRHEMVHHSKILRYLEFKKDLTATPVMPEGQQSVIERMRARQRHGEERHLRSRVPAQTTPVEPQGAMDEQEVDKKIEELLQ